MLKMNKIEQKYSTFRTFIPHFNALARVGYFKIVLKNLTAQKLTMHFVYRIIVWILVISYNLQHLIRVVQTRHSTDQMIDTLFILLTTLNALGKQIAFNIRSERIDRIINVINGPLFASTKQYHINLMKQETVVMSRLLRLYQVMVLTCALLWTIFPLVNRVLSLPVQFTGYIPFDTTLVVAFAVAHAYMSVTITLQGYGNVTMDCTIVAFFSQAKTQIRMLRNNLEQLVDATKINGKLIGRHNNQNVYEDNKDERILLQRRFVRCVEHYKQIVWYVKEVESIFGEAMIVQLLVMTWVICMTVYKIVGLSIISAEFVSMAVYLGCMLAQLFIYCYFGTQLKVEVCIEKSLQSEFVNQSVYNSDWLSLSPRFRRQLLVLMHACSRPIAPRIAYVVPMSLETYITVLKHSYTLFTFLDRK